MAELHHQSQSRYAEAKTLAALVEALVAAGDGPAARTAAGAATLLFQQLGNDTEAARVSAMAHVGA